MTTPLPEQFKTGTYFGESGFSSTLPPALPEQGGFDERLSDILDRFKQGCDPYFSQDIRYGRTKEETEAAIRTLVLEEIIGEDETSLSDDYAELHKWVYATQNKLRAEQRKKLERSKG